MKLGCSSWSYHRSFEEKKIDAKDFINICADKLKLTGIELLDFHFDPEKIDVKEIKNLIVDKGLTISSVSVSNNFGYKKKKKLKKEIDKVKRWIDITREYGSSILRVFAGWPMCAPWDKGFGKDKYNREEFWNEMIECIKKCVEYGEKAKIVLAVENHNHNGFINSKESAIRIIEEINSPWFRLNLDTAGYITDRYNSIEKTLPLAVQLHIKILKMAKDGSDEELDYEKIFEILKKSTYNGFLSL